MDPSGETWLQNFESRVADMQRKSAALAEGLAEASATVSSPDGSVTVRIGANGGLENLELGHRATEHSPARLTALIMETVRRGQRMAAHKVSEAFAPMGPNSEAMRLISRFAPPPADEPGGDGEDPFPVEDSAAEPPRADRRQPPPQHPRPPAPPARPTGRQRPAEDDDDDVDLW
ncbi:YbaB/EbfC family nucleoid-associated protein [Gandjariella thermophila]|uniref:YbaB/EbfC DNA-binding family protein n=1 Tax=Gandjariella thermophila TaxID=1931992 RepID=A0A4D4IYA0_9PSEU|nr:YbaB/EbfC family nucleoid-associated protein [Gandjariella thermophila]GDY29211.1 hypothetical protein GTS_08440 [Gandjariella thermophila]